MASDGVRHGDPGEMLKFTFARSSATAGARLGELTVRGRTLSTPNYFANTSRGAVPHLSQDVQRDHTAIGGVYMALEDFVEKRPPKISPIYQTPVSDGESRLRKFTGCLSNTTLVLGPRRAVALPTPASNTNSSIELSTSVGFRPMKVEEYIDAADLLDPDIIVGPGDIPPDFQSPSIKRIEKAADRSSAWMKQMIAERAGYDGVHCSLFAPLVSAPAEQQRWYLNDLQDELLEHISGLAVYDLCTLEGIPKSLARLPRLDLATRQLHGPADVLKAISLGIDIFILPFVGDTTDAGIILDFRFPPPQKGADGPRQPLGVDAWDTEHATDLSPLVVGCSCYACKTHHRAYLQHLLNAKEMLAWVLLQIHNHRIMDEFFAGVRRSIAKGTFEEDVAAFEQHYESQLPEKVGKGPRVRGYQYKTIGPGESKKNVKAYNRIDDTSEVMAESTPPAENVDAAELAGHGLGSVEAGKNAVS